MTTAKMKFLLSYNMKIIGRWGGGGRMSKFLASGESPPSHLLKGGAGAPSSSRNPDGCGQACHSIQQVS